jgi:alginate O-acetyltransferase complex protein AlgJ
MNNPKSLRLEEWLATVAMLGVMSVGMFQAVSSLQSPAVRDISMSISEFRDGRVTAALSSQLDKNLPLRTEIIAWANAGRFLLTRGAGDQVRLGQDGWLFSVEEMQYFPMGRNHEDARLAILSRVGSELKARGVSLVVALVPDKSRMLQHKLSGGRYPDWHSERYGYLVTTLRQRGIEVVDLQAALASKGTESSLYYRTDTHWNQSGGKRAALAVAQQVKALAPDLAPSTFLTRPTGVTDQRAGDLLRMMGLADMPNWTRPKPDLEVPEVTTKMESAQPEGLFDTVGVPVVLMGTSYSLRGNFHGYFQEALGAEVLNVARDGGGFIQSAKAYLADESFQTSKPQVIVWEIPERVFSPPLTEVETKGLSF